MTMKVLAAALAAASLGLLAACGSAPSATTGTPTATAIASDRPVSAPAPAPATAYQTAVRIKAAVKHATGITRLTAATDGNHMLGRPNGYTAATVIDDSRAQCSGGPGVDCGAVIEQWPSTSDTKARASYLQRVLKADPMLGSEWDIVKGGLLLRVSGTLTPAAEKVYAAAFTGTAVTAVTAAPAPSAALRNAVQAYTNAYLGGNLAAAWSILSRRCQAKIGRSEFASVVKAAGQVYGALPLTSFHATISGTMARATYSVAVKKLDQTDQPWTLVNGAWRYDAC